MHNAKLEIVRTGFLIFPLVRAFRNPEQNSIPLLDKKESCAIEASNKFISTQFCKCQVQPRRPKRFTTVSREAR